MSSNKKILAVLISLTLFGSAQQKMSLTVEQAVQIGLENSKSLRTSQFKVQAAEAKASETGTLGLPSLKFQGAYSRLSDIPPAEVTTPFGKFPLSPTVLDNYTLKATVQQPLFTGWKISGAEDAAEYSSEATKQDFQKDRADVIYNIKSAYWNLYRANEFKKFVDENVQQIQSHVTDAENLLKQGMLTSNDVLKVQVQLSDAKVRQIDATNNVKLAMIALNNTLGQPLSTQIEIVSLLQQPVSAQSDIDGLVKRAFDSRPDILAMSARVKASEAGLTSARGGWWPQIYLVGNYNYLRPNQRIFPTKDEFKDTWDVTLSVSFDIWNWNQTGHQTTQAQAQVAQAEEGLSLMKDGVTLEVTQSYLTVNQTKERAAVAEQGVAQAQENYRIMNDRFKKGLVPNSELLDAEVALLQAQLNKTQSLVEYELAVARLSKSIGE
ncbi:MAG: TolC family protein [Ignavibacteriales bacterium]|nr:TolC family protein [Ignavibacteriales bacterium]